MAKALRGFIENMDFSFEHSPVKVVANRNCPEIKLAGLNLGPFEEGNEYELQFWVAKELEKAGIARFREEQRLDAAAVYKIQWTERVQTSGQVSRLPENFYPKLRRYLKELKAESTKNPEKMREYEKITGSIRDVVNARLKKLVSIASASAQTEQVLKNFTSEERLLYDQLHKFIHKWRTRILEYEEVEE
jgi:hypothetical protein